MLAEWAPGRVGVKLSPTMAIGGFEPTDQTVATLQSSGGAPLAIFHCLTSKLVKAPNDLKGHARSRLLQDNRRLFSGPA